MQRASVNMVKATEELKNCVKVWDVTDISIFILSKGCKNEKFCH